MVKNLPAMQETWVQSLGWKDPLEKGKATHSSILPGECYGLCRPWGHGRKESDMTEQLSLYVKMDLKWITNYDLLYSTWKSAHCNVAA